MEQGSLGCNVAVGPLSLPSPPIWVASHGDTDVKQQNSYRHFTWTDIRRHGRTQLCYMNDFPATH